MPETGNAKYRALLLSFAVVAAAGVVAVLVVMGWLLTVVLDQSEINGNTSRAVLDCVDKQGECYNEASRRTAGVVTSINDGTFRVIVAALACQEDGITEEKALAECTAERAAKVVLPK